MVEEVDRLKLDLGYQSQPGRRGRGDTAGFCIREREDRSANVGDQGDRMGDANRSSTQAFRSDIGRRVGNYSINTGSDELGTG